MRAQIAERKAEVWAQPPSGIDKDDTEQDLFSMLVRATEGEGKLRLDDDDLVCLTPVFRRVRHADSLLAHGIFQTVDGQLVCTPHHWARYVVVFLSTNCALILGNS
jgi:hypothetical protein